LHDHNYRRSIDNSNRMARSNDTFLLSLFRPATIELRRMDGRFRLLDGCGSGALTLRPLIETFVGLDADTVQPSTAVDFLVGQRHCLYIIGLASQFSAVGGK
jgi:hypothetical protein